MRQFVCQLPWLALLITASSMAQSSAQAPPDLRTLPSSPIHVAAIKPAVRHGSGDGVSSVNQVAYNSRATGQGCASGACGGCNNCCQSCPHCRERCIPEVSKEDVKKHAWDVECKKICIPRVSFPWQLCKSKHACPGCGKSCCDKDAVCTCGCPQPAKCAKVRTIRVLVKHEYKCKKCKYTWSVKSVNCCNNCVNPPNGPGGDANLSSDAPLNQEADMPTNPKPADANSAKPEVSREPDASPPMPPMPKTALLFTPNAHSRVAPTVTIPRGEVLPPLPR